MVAMRAVLSVTVLVMLSIGSQLFAQDNGSCRTTYWYCVQDLNAGLVEAGGLIDRSTPRSSFESLVEAARRGSWEEAAHLLDLSGIPEDLRQIEGAKLIAQLHTVISRKTVIDWDRILDRPDGIDASAASEGSAVFKPRKSLLLWTLELDEYPAAIRLNRIKPDTKDAVWVFPRQTVENIPALFESYGPGRLERILPDVAKKKVVFDLAWWEIIGLPMLIALAVFLGWLLWNGVRWLADRVTSVLLSDILASIRGPLALGTATSFALIVGSSVFVFSAEITTFIVPIAWLGIMGAILWLVVNTVEVILDRLTTFDETDLTQIEEEHKRTTATRVAAARRVFIVTVVLLGAGAFLSQTNIFRNLGLAVIGTAGAATLVLGFAARRVLGNIMASLQIALNGSAKIGDRVVYDGYLCHVERINFTFVQLRDWDGTRLVVPVEEFASTPFENWTMKEPKMLRTVKIKCTHNADVGALRAAFDDVVAELDGEDLGNIEDVSVRVADQDAFGKDVWFALPCSNPNTSWDIACRAREKIMAAGTKLAEERGVDFFPQATPVEAS